MSAIKQCRVCGKSYEYCGKLRSVESAFRWQDVACSPECGSVYLDRIIKSRSGNQPVEAQAVSCDEGDVYEKIEQEENELNEYFGSDDED